MTVTMFDGELQVTPDYLRGDLERLVKEWWHAHSPLPGKTDWRPPQWEAFKVRQIDSARVEIQAFATNGIEGEFVTIGTVWMRPTDNLSRYHVKLDYDESHLFGDERVKSLLDGIVERLRELGTQDTQASAALGEGLSAKGEPTSYDRAKLRQNLADHFNIDELRTLCFDMGIKHENLRADTLDGMTRELVDYCYRFGKIRELVAQCRKLRPNGSWEEVP